MHHPGPNRLASLIFAGLLVCLCPVAQATDDLVNLNTASEEELAKLPGVGAAVAKRIVDYREQNGPFAEVDDLQKVKGLSGAVVERLRGFVEAGPSGAARSRTPVETMPPDRADADASPSAVQRLLARYQDEPTVREVQEAATRFAEVRPELITSWRSRARKAGLGPQLRAEYRHVQQYDYVTQESSTGSTGRTSDGTEYRPLARAQWDLDRLIFNPDELRVSNEVVDLVRLRESVLDQVTKVYFERRRLQVELELTPPGDLAGRVRKELRLQELVADLDALTGGFFSKKLSERGSDRR